MSGSVGRGAPRHERVPEAPANRVALTFLRGVVCHCVGSRCGPFGHRGSCVLRQQYVYCTTVRSVRDVLCAWIIGFVGAAAKARGKLFGLVGACDCHGAQLVLVVRCGGERGRYYNSVCIPFCCESRRVSLICISDRERLVRAVHVEGHRMRGYVVGSGCTCQSVVVRVTGVGAGADGGGEGSDRDDFFHGVSFEFQIVRREVSALRQ